MTQISQMAGSLHNQRLNQLAQYSSSPVYLGFSYTISSIAVSVHCRCQQLLHLLTKQWTG